MSNGAAYLLDANVVSEMMRSSPEPRVATFLDAVAEDGLALASITIWEILNGVRRLDPGRRREDLLARFNGVVEDLFADRVLDWSVGDAEACAMIMEGRRRQGAPLDDHLPDVTRNESEFHDTGVRIVNPWRA